MAESLRRPAGWEDLLATPEGAKAELYLRSGVPHYWLVDTEARTLEAFEARSRHWVRLGAWGDGDHGRIPPFDAVEMEISALFPPPPAAAESAGEESSNPRT